MLFTSGCVEKKINVSAGDNNNTKSYLVYDLGGFPENLNQLDKYNLRSGDLLLALFEGLVKKDENGNLVPGLAQDWTVSEDGITYTFNLRENAKWSDGTKIKAQDFVEFFKEILSSKRDNIYAYQLYYIFGSEEYNKGRKSFNNVAVKAVDDNTLQIRLNARASCFLEILSEPIYTLRKVGKELENFKENYKSISYTGPFRIDNISDGELTLTKNSSYYSPYNVKSEKIYITSSKSSENALASFQTSEINVFLNPPLKEAKNLIIDGEAEVIAINSGSSINFNLKGQENVSRADFRKAVSSAIDREKLVSEVLNGVGIGAYSYIPHTYKESSNNIIKEKVPTEEREDMPLNEGNTENIGYDKSKKLKLIYLNSIENKRICEAIAKDMKESLDLNIACIGYAEEGFLEAIKNGDYDMAKVDYASPYNDPLSILEPWASASQFNIFGYNNAEFDSLILKIKFEKDKSKREGLIKEAEKVFINDMPSIPLYFHNAVLCKKSSVQGVYVTAEGNVKLDRAYVGF